MTRNTPETGYSTRQTGSAPAARHNVEQMRNTLAAGRGAEPVWNAPASRRGAGRARGLWHSALCALILLLCTALLAACAPGVSGASGVSDPTGTMGASGTVGDSDTVGTSGNTDTGEPAAGPSGTDISLPDGPDSGISGTGDSDTEGSDPGASPSGVLNAGTIPAQGASSADTPLPATGADNFGDGEDLCGLPLAPDSGAEFPEPDHAATLADGTVALYLDAREFVLGEDDAVGYTIENTTGHSVGVVFAPKLERWTNGVWEWIPSDTGFCGTPDPVDETYSGSLRLDWFSNLTEGVYRLTYTLGFTKTAASDGHTIFSENYPFSACFYLRNP